MLVAIRKLTEDKVRQKVTLLLRYRSHGKTAVATLNLSCNAASIIESERARCTDDPSVAAHCGQGSVDADDRLL